MELVKTRDWLAINSWNKNSSGPMSGRKYSRKVKYKKDYSDG